jgi:glycosyltransferase involved in cell wall biosynthesis
VVSVGEKNTVTEKVVDLDFTQENPTKKIKILTLSDHPLSPSGVGTQTKYVIVELLKTGRYEFISLGGAIKHENYQPIQVEEFKDSWTIFPVDGYGDPDTIRSILRTHKPDILWFMTDPRFYSWLWQAENEIRSLVPMVYYHVWDNYPYPEFNKIWYDSTDVVATISKLTSDIVQTVSPNVREEYIPHAVPSLFDKAEPNQTQDCRKQLGIEDDRFLVFWNNRNARRKQSGSLVFWYKEFMDKLHAKNKNAKTTLLMHTEVNDPNGQDLYAIANKLGLNANDPKEFLVSSEKMSIENLSVIYSTADVTISVSDAEGFGLATFESLACETPIITTMTGGLQEQVTNIKKISDNIISKRNAKNAGKCVEYAHGLGLEPASRAVIGSQEVPYIYEDRLSKEQVIEALMKMYEYGPEKRAEIGAAGRQHVLNNYSFEKFTESWDKLLTETHEKLGSWETRKGYNNWEMRKV